MPRTLMTPSPSARRAPGAVYAARGVGRGSGPRLRDLFLDHAGSDLRKHLARGELAVAERRVQVFHLAVARTPPATRSRSALVTLPSWTPSRRASFSRYFWPISMALHALAGVDDVLDLVARARGLDERQPVLARLVAGLRHDLDDVAVAQRGAQRHDAAVHLGADAGAAHIGVNGVGEIDGRGVARQHDHLAARREGVDLLRVQVHLEGGHELAGVLHCRAAIPPGGAARRCADRRPRGPCALPCTSSAPRCLPRRCGASPRCGSAPRRSARAGRPRRCAATGRDSAAEWR